MRSLWRRLQFLLDRRCFDCDLDEEIRDHLERKRADFGSETQARRQFGNVTRVTEESRQVWTGNFGEQLVQDLRYAFRSVAAHKLFTAIAMLSLALGIGANTAIFSFMDAVMLRALPVDHPEQLVILNWRAKTEPPVVAGHWGSMYDHPGGGITSPNFPYAAFELLREDNQAFSSLFGHADARRLNVVLNGQAEIADGQYVTGGLFAGLGVRPAAGRLIGREDDQQGAPPIAVLAYHYWWANYGRSAAIIGQVIRINGVPFTVAGVAAPDFAGVNSSIKPSVFLPMSSLALIGHGDRGAFFTKRNTYWIELMGRLKPGVTLATAQAQLAGPFHNFALSTARNARQRAELPILWLQEGGSGVDAMRRQYEQPLTILMGMVALILLIACANLANLLLARAAGRRREMAVRLSLGAGRLRVIRQLLTESLLLSLASAVAGVGIAALVIRAMLALLANGDEAFTAKVALDGRVLVFTLVVAIGATLLFGLVPALQATRIDITPALKETRAGEARRRYHWISLSQALVVAQIATALLLVVAASLFVRTLTNLHAVQLGFNAERLLTFNLDASKAGIADEALTRFYADLEERVQALPGVRGATTSDLPLVGGYSSSTAVSLPGAPEPPEGQRRPSTAYAKVGVTFFETMETPILQGRALRATDRGGAQTAAVVNQVFADKYFRGQNPVGRHFGLGGGKDALDVEIVGVSRTARYNSLKREIPPVTYLSWRQATGDRRVKQMFFEVRTAGDPLALAGAVRELVRQASPLVPVAGITTQTQRIDQTIRQERTFAQLCTWFGGLALLMACIGLYGTMAYGVARRTSEIGIRMALGAARARIVWTVLREVLTLSAIGLAIGLAAAYQGTSLLKSFLFGLEPQDPLALAISAAMLLGCSLLAGFLPARRASRVDPLVALRHD